MRTVSVSDLRRPSSHRHPPTSQSKCIDLVSDLRRPSSHRHADGLCDEEDQFVPISNLRRPSSHRHKRHKSSDGRRRCLGFCGARAAIVTSGSWSRSGIEHMSSRISGARAAIVTLPVGSGGALVALSDLRRPSSHRHRVWSALKWRRWRVSDLTSAEQPSSQPVVRTDRDISAASRIYGARAAIVTEP